MSASDADLLNAYRGIVELARSTDRELSVLLTIAAYDTIEKYHPDPLSGEENIYWEIDFGDGYPPLIFDRIERECRTFFDLTNL